MKKHNSLKVVLITLIVFVLLTWILPAAYFQTEYVDQGRVQMGLFDLFSYPITAVSYFGYIALYVLAIGGFYGVLGKTGAYRNLLDRMVSKFKGKEKIVLSVIMILLAVLTSVCGLDIALLFFFPMIISLVLLMGYDKLTAALVTVGSVVVGMAGSTFAYNMHSVVNASLSLDKTTEIVSKVAILILGLVLLIFNVIKRDGKVSVKKEEKKKTEITKTKETKNSKDKKATKTTTKAAIKEEKKVVVKEKEENEFVPASISSKKKNAVWPLITILSIVTIIMILSFISWSNMFGLDAFEKATTAVSEFKLFGFAIFGKLLGTMNAFGGWSLAELILVLFFGSAIISLIYRISFDDYLDGFAKGVKKALLPAFIIVLIYSCLVITTYHPFQTTIYKAILELTKGFNIVTASVVTILSAVFNVDPTYASQSVIPYMASLVTDITKYPLIGVIFQSLYGLTMLVAPTSLILMSVLSYLNISYKEWFKNIWKLLLEFLVILIIIFIILMVI